MSDRTSQNLIHFVLHYDLSPVLHIRKFTDILKPEIIRSSVPAPVAGSMLMLVGLVPLVNSVDPIENRHHSIEKQRLL